MNNLTRTKVLCYGDSNTWGDPPYLDEKAHAKIAEILKKEVKNVKD